MGRSGETNPSRGFWKPIIPAIALLCTLPLVAQKAQETSPPKYDCPHRDQDERHRGGSETASKR
jgi:hypothetical protein